MSPFVKLFIQWVMFALSFAPAIVSAKTPDQNLEGAACVVRVDDKLVLVHEVITQKQSLPAGQVKRGEDPAIAAQRETWEETGLVVSVKGVLGRTDKAIFYDCVSDSDIVVFEFNNIYDGLELPIWFSPHYGVEISSAMLVNPSNVPLSQYRFPEQRDLLIEFLEQASNQRVTYVENLVDAAPSFNQIELDWILSFQSSIHSLPYGLSEVVHRAIISGNLLAEPILLIILFPLFYMLYGKGFLSRALFVTTITALMTIMAQQGFAFPRPHVYLPAVDLLQTYGFSFPSTPAALWIALGVLILNENNKLGINRYSFSLAMLFAWLGLSKFYTGSSFIIDVASGALIGFLTSWHVIRLEYKQNVNAAPLLSSGYVWIMQLLICGGVLFAWPSLTAGYWFMFILASFILLSLIEKHCSVIKPVATVFLIITLLVVNFSISVAGTYVTHSSLISLVFELMRYPLLMVLFAISIRKKVVEQ